MSNFRAQNLAMFGNDTEAAFQTEFTQRNFATLQAALADPRLPISAIGYVADLQNSDCSWPVALDRMKMIRHHLPNIKFWGE